MSRVVFLDCGTHEGQGLKELAPQLPRGTEVHCFEPNPTVELDAEILLDEIMSVGLRPSSVTVHDEAIYDRDGTITFISTGCYPRGGLEKNGRGQASGINRLGNRHIEAIQKTEVPCVSLCGFIRSLDLQEGDEVHIKLDVEGAEYATLKQLLKDGDDVIPFIKRIWIEWHGRYYEAESWERNKGAQELTSELRKKGVTVHEWR